MKKRLQAAGVLLCLLGPVTARAQTAVDIASEPHHHQLLENAQLRVFDVTIAAHSSTLLTRHEHNYLVITLCDCEIASWAEGQAGVITYRYNRNDIRFFFGGPARTMRNDTPNEYHNLTVEFLSPKVTTFGYQPEAGRWEYGSSAMPPPVDSRAKFADVLDLGEGTVKDVQLLPDDSYPPPEKEAAELVIALTDLDLKTTNHRVRKSQGELLWIDPGRKSDLVNNDTEPARFVVIELRLQASSEEPSGF
ncbi:MAG TPA: hypothetical protein VMT28_00030 [Terriglobales bacterium]|jgi:hypothetical protein|nr:hypothetical protein [Terriglobales bacterium]